MRGGVSLAAALAIPIAAGSHPFPMRDVIIFLAFAVLLVTLVGQGGSLPFAIRAAGLRAEPDVEEGEDRGIRVAERAALDYIAKCERTGRVQPEVLTALRSRFGSQWASFGSRKESAVQAASYQQLEREILDEQRMALTRLVERGQINTDAHRRVQRVLDLETSRSEYLGSRALM
jgi:monovalent cation/hydrogen antiporter